MNFAAPGDIGRADSVHDIRNCADNVIMKN